MSETAEYGSMGNWSYSL